MNVAAATAPMIQGSRAIWCPYITLLMRVLEETGRAKLQSRLMIISRKLPSRSQRRGLTSFQTSGMTFFNFGFGRDLLRSAVVDLPTPREGRSAAFIPPPNLDGPKEEDIDIPSLRRRAMILYEKTDESRSAGRTLVLFPL